METKFEFILLTTTIFFLWGCGGTAEPPTHSESGAPIALKVGAVTSESVQMVFEAVGTVRPKVATRLSSKILGHVTSVHFDVGDHVRQGQLLVEIDTREPEVRLTQAAAGLKEAQSALKEVDGSIEATRSGLGAAKANAKLAESTHGRFVELLARKSVSQQEFDEVDARLTAARSEVQRTEEMLLSVEAKRSQAEARIEQAAAGVRSAELSLSHTKVFAPFRGLVTSKNVEVGQLASPEQELLVIDDPSLYRLESLVGESQIRQVSVGQIVDLRIDSLDGRLEGKVDEIVPVADPASRSFTVKIALPRAQGVRSGLYGVARFPAEERELLSVPKTAIVQRGQVLGIFVLDSDDRVRLRLIRTGKDVGNRIEILSGVSEGDQIITEPPEGLQDGRKVAASRDTASILSFNRNPSRSGRCGVFSGCESVELHVVTVS